MPLQSKDPGKNISKLHKEHAGEKDWPRKRIIAAGMNAARRAGGNVPENKTAMVNIPQTLFAILHPSLRKLGMLHKVAATRARMDGIPIAGDMDMKNAAFALGMKIAMTKLKFRAINRGLSAMRHLEV